MSIQETVTRQMKEAMKAKDLQVGMGPHAQDFPKSVIQAPPGDAQLIGQRVDRQDIEVPSPEESLRISHDAECARCRQQSRRNTVACGKPGLKGGIQTYQYPVARQQVIGTFLRGTPGFNNLLDRPAALVDQGAKNLSRDRLSGCGVELPPHRIDE